MTRDLLFAAFMLAFTVLSAWSMTTRATNPLAYRAWHEDEDE